MERTISGMVGKGSVNHNTRAFTAKNVDSDRSGDNIHFCNEDIKQVYHKLFDEALERYNANRRKLGAIADIPVYSIPYPQIKKIAAIKNHIWGL